MGKKRVLVGVTLVLVGVMVFVGPALAGTLLTANLTGAAEVDGAGNPNQGDLDGSGTADLTLLPKRERICYELTVTNIDPANAAHIHKAPAGQNGDIVKTLKAPTDGSSMGCVRSSRMMIRKIKNDPSGYYVNVHNVPFPNGALRGQLTTSP